MDEFGGVTLEEISKELERLSIGGKTPREIDELNCKISILTNKEFADEVTNIVAAEHNPYNRLEQIRRMENIIDMLSYGISQEKVKEILELHLDDFAVDFIRWKGL